MSNLSKRVQKAKGLTWSHNPYNPAHYGTWGADKDNGERYYDIDLSHSKETINTPDGRRQVIVLQATCKQNTGIVCDCPGNSHHTVCYHSIGALHESFKKVGKLISFFETYEAALLRKFNGKIVKIKSLQGQGFLWAVVKEWPKSKKEDKKDEVLRNIDLMRGSEDDEGID
jgi:hypothetical protein